MSENQTCDRCGAPLQYYGAVGWDCSSAECIQAELKAGLREMGRKDRQAKRFTDAAPAMVDALENLMGRLDTPIGRRKIGDDEFFLDAFKSARAALKLAKGAAEAMIDISTDLVRDSLCQAGTETSAVSSSPSALQSRSEQTEESGDITNKLFSASDICEQAVTELLAARSRIAELEGALQARNQPDDLRSENEKLREALKPFAAWLDTFDRLEKNLMSPLRDDEKANSFYNSPFSIGDLRRARAALKKAEGEKA